MILASVTFGQVVGVLISAFVTGALARLAVPGPDPMPAWLTILIGLGGSLGGGGVAYAAGARNAYVISLVGFAVAIALVVAYRRLVQRRPVLGRDAYRFPERGIGVDAYRERLQRAGIDPDRIGAGPMVPAATRAPTNQEEPTDNPAHFIRLLDELHDAGVLEDEEYGAARTRLLQSLRD
ncbi:MAG: SHOCT domain-containing protein [Acidobacteriota bacterium]|nr:SHOCT domain-containing protein [Acidobacteriota bacterium]MDE3189445.1 SHOCT domain-containing protein [Acidobacteriota bacterium]